MASSSSSPPRKFSVVSVPLRGGKSERPAERKEDSGTRKNKSSGKMPPEIFEELASGLADLLGSGDYPPATPVRLTFGSRPVAESKKFEDEPNGTTKPKVLSKLYKKGRYEGVETETCYKLRLLVPGCRKDELKITLENDQLLCISPNKPKELEEENDCWVDDLELPKLDIDVPKDASASELSIKFHDGLLLVTIPKKPKKVVEFSIKEE